MSGLLTITVKDLMGFDPINPHRAASYLTKEQLVKGKTYSIA